jgi:hypothetical protein
MTANPEPPADGSSQAGRQRLGVAIERATDVMERAASSARNLASLVSVTAQETRIRANETTTSLQILPDSTLGGLAAGSIGLGAGFYLAGVPRLVTAAAVAPAMILGAAMILRPGDPADKAEPSS